MKRETVGFLVVVALVGAGFFFWRRMRWSREHYPPNSQAAIDLFTEAARLNGQPEEWGSSPGLHNVLRRESAGWVGRPNFTYGEGNAGKRFGSDISSTDSRERWPEVWDELKGGTKGARSTATGLGQLILGNTETYYPEGAQGIGDPMQEARGMLNYIESRYGDPENAWEMYGTQFAGY